MTKEYWRIQREYPSESHKIVDASPKRNSIHHHRRVLGPVSHISIVPEITTLKHKFHYPIRSPIKS